MTIPTATAPYQTTQIPPQLAPRVSPDVRATCRSQQGPYHSIKHHCANTCLLTRRTFLVTGGTFSAPAHDGTLSTRTFLGKVLALGPPSDVLAHLLAQLHPQRQTGPLGRPIKVSSTLPICAPRVCASTIHLTHSRLRKGTRATNLSACQGTHRMSQNTLWGCITICLQWQGDWRHSWVVLRRNPWVNLGGLSTHILEAHRLEGWYSPKYDRPEALLGAVDAAEPGDGLGYW